MYPLRALPQSHGYDSILVTVDCLSKRAHFIATMSDITSLGVIQLFQDSIWKLHGLPKEVISDRGPQFMSNFMRRLSEILGIKVTASMAYHPQTDSQTERVNQEVEQFLCLFVNQRQDNWYNWLSIAEFAYNDQVHASTQTSPFMLDAGQNPQLGFEPICESRLKSLDNFVSRMAQAMEEAQAALVKAADDMAQFYDAHQCEAPQYNVSDRVWLSLENVRTVRPMKKLDYKWLGPYIIEQVISHSAYRLKLPVKLTPSSQSLSYIPLRMTQSPNARNATHCCHPRSFAMGLKSMKSKRSSTVGYSTETERLSTWYTGRAMVLKKTNGAPSMMYRAPSNLSLNSTAPTCKLLTLSQHCALGCCTFEGGVMSWFVPRSSMSLQSQASTSDSSTHLQRFRISL